MVSLFASAFLLGLVFNAAPGAVFAETVRQGLRGGFRPALQVQLGSLAGDALWAVLGLTGMGLLLSLDFLHWPLGLGGVAYLLWLARDAWREASREFSVDTSSVNPSGRALRAGVWLSISNPQNVGYWAAIAGALGALGVHEPRATDYATFFAGLMAASVLWCFVCAAGVALLFRRAGPAWARLTYRACAIAFLVLALGTLRDLFAERLPASAPMERAPAVSRP